MWRSNRVVRVRCSGARSSDLSEVVHLPVCMN